jgi:hypothetical protein
MFHTTNVRTNPECKKSAAIYVDFLRVDRPSFPAVPVEI